MILLTKLDSNKVLINLDTVKYLESIPDTLIHFLNGESLIVKESLDDISKMILSYKSEVLRESYKN
ncbi:MAG: flagellar FlbD family protein [Oligoflexales bacterium]|nr:flagellar FlbD family protein [Oligoflexales bacterium]